MIRVIRVIRVIPIKKMVDMHNKIEMFKVISFKVTYHGRRGKLTGNQCND